MLCQNCQHNTATTHIKRIVNGESAEIHLCASCAKNLGVSDVFPSVSADFGGLFREVISPSDLKRAGERTIRCEICGFTFEDIAATGRPGCPDCYRIFGDKLNPALRRIHGRAKHRGKIPASSRGGTVLEYKIETLKAKLNEAIDEQNFERAAQLRDEIRALSAERKRSGENE